MKYKLAITTLELDTISVARDTEELARLKVILNSKVVIKALDSASSFREFC